MLRNLRLSSKPRLPPQEYTKWTTPALISRIQELEKALPNPPPLPTRPFFNYQSNFPTSLASSSSSTRQRPKKPRKPINFSLYSTRLVAFKLSYIGSHYNGFEHQTGHATPLPTVEEEIFKALLKARLVPGSRRGQEEGEEEEEEEGGGGIGVESWPGSEVAGYSKCGRTDRGVSAFGQVIAVRVRSNRPLPGSSEGKEFDDIKDELPYPEILNSLLPRTIRILAWCPNPPPNFSARSNCTERRYRYYFSNPAINDNGDGYSGHLDIPAMRDAAARFIGTHDFRNFCKIDASKQLSSFQRCIRHISISPTNPLQNTTTTQQQQQQQKQQMYTVSIHGSSFLWHQVRHIISVLFLIGQNLEPPSLITALLDISKTPQKPVYEMAHPHPLVLWECVFPREMLKWVYCSENRVLNVVWTEWYKAGIEEVMKRELVDCVVSQSSPTTTTPSPSSSSSSSSSPSNNALETETQKPGTKPTQLPQPPSPQNFSVPHYLTTATTQWKKCKKLQGLVNGSGETVFRGRYVNVLERKKLDGVEKINQKWRERREKREKSEQEEEERWSG